MESLEYWFYLEGVVRWCEGESVLWNGGQGEIVWAIRRGDTG